MGCKCTFTYATVKYDFCFSSIPRLNVININLKLCFWLIDLPAHLTKKIYIHTHIKIKVQIFCQFLNVWKNFFFSKMSKLQDKYTNTIVITIAQNDYFNPTPAHYWNFTILMCPAVDFYSHMKYLHWREVIRCPRGSLNANSIWLQPTFSNWQATFTT